jgi:hypothetical protein
MLAIYLHHAKERSLMLWPDSQTLGDLKRFLFVELYQQEDDEWSEPNPFSRDFSVLRQEDYEFVSVTGEALPEDKRLRDIDNLRDEIELFLQLKKHHSDTD